MFPFKNVTLSAALFHASYSTYIIYKTGGPYSLQSSIEIKNTVVNFRFCCEKKTLLVYFFFFRSSIYCVLIRRTLKLSVS